MTGCVPRKATHKGVLELVAVDSNESCEALEQESDIVIARDRMCLVALGKMASGTGEHTKEPTGLPCMAVLFTDACPPLFTEKLRIVGIRMSTPYSNTLSSLGVIGATN